jgi:integrase
MFRTVGDQPTLWEAILPDELRRLPVELARVDVLLDDPVFFAPFAPFFDPRVGRPSTPMATYLRLMFLKMDAANVRRNLRRALTLVPGLNPADWTPRELRHSFVSVLSDAGLPVEEISHLVGHRGTTVTELVYRHQLRPVVQTGATIMDRLFSRRNEGA